jgi:hypothetical protein
MAPSYAAEDVRAAADRSAGLTGRIDVEDLLARSFRAFASANEPRENPHGMSRFTRNW